jgi:hypothetical protein
MRASRHIVKTLGFGALAWTLMCSGGSARAQQKSLFCVPACNQRPAPGVCLMYGPDFCTPIPETACVAYCNQRSATGACLHYGPDFCGIAPQCSLYCDQRSATGMCTAYGPDLCVENVTTSTRNGLEPLATCSQEPIW